MKVKDLVEAIKRGESGETIIANFYCGVEYIGTCDISSIMVRPLMDYTVFSIEHITDDVDDAVYKIELGEDDDVH